MTAQPSYSAHDLCQSIFLTLNCDGSVASNQDAYVLVGPTTASDTTVTMVLPIVTETPNFGKIILDTAGASTGPLTVSYESVNRTTGVFTLSGTTTVGAIVAASAACTIARSEPIVHCALTQIRLVPQVTGELIDEDPSGQGNQNVAYRRIAPQRNGYILEGDLSSRENPELWALLDQFAPIYDPAEPDQWIGFEEVVQSASDCPTCGGTGAACAHGVAAIFIFNAWCGTERHPEFPYVALICRSLIFEPSTENFVRGRGFSTRSMTATLKSNSLSADPWGIDPRGAGQLATWSEMQITQTAIDADADLLALLTNGCGCGACPNPSLLWPTP